MDLNKHQTNVGMSLGAKPVNVKNDSPLEQAIDRLGAINSQLNDEFKALENRLGPILLKMPPPDAGLNQPHAPLTGSSEIVERLCLRADQLYQLVVFVREIRERLEV